MLEPWRTPGAMLKSLKGIGPEFAGVLWSEGLFRSFSNRRQVASYAGLAPTLWQSGSVAHEQGVSKAGNPRLRTTMIQLAWLWLRHQPRSILTLWFHTRGSPRLYASNARTRASPSILSVFARRRRRDVAIEAGSTTWLSTPSSCSNRWIQKPSRPAS